MCGICGIYQYANGQHVDPQVLHDMLWSIKHRGPDDEGIHRERELAIGMRRLSIIDLSGGAQPIYNEDRSVAIVFNGEIYNYRELRERLLQRGHYLATASDTEVIVHLYEDLGEDCVNELRGMFGLAIWDARRQRLFIARDRLGIKPLYYSQTRNGLIFASEIKAILQHPDVHAQLNLEGLSNFLTLKYVPAPQTMFAGIMALPPGHCITCDRNGMKVRSYWDVSFANQHTSGRNEDSYAEELEGLLRDAVRSHLVSDVPFGAFLSGGVDSSTIVALMSQFLSQPVKTFAVGYEGDGAEYSELPFARMVAQQYQTDHHEIFIKPQDLIDLAEKIVWHQDQPIADEAALANYMVAELASRHVKMVLTGEGGDELFAGYARYSGERFASILSRMPTMAHHILLNMSKRAPGMRRLKLALYASCQKDEVARLTNWFTLLNSDTKAALLSDQMAGSLNGSSTYDVFAQHLARTDGTDYLSRMLYVDTKLWLPDDLLARGDKTSMAASIEARVPLLDHKLVEFAASVPSRYKVKGMTRKYLLKRVSSAWLPPEIIHRKKKGFPIPVSIWFRKEARSFVHDLLSPDLIRRRGLFNPGYVGKLLNEHDTGFADHGSLLWALLSVELWHQLFIDSRAAIPAEASSIAMLSK